MLHFVQHDTPAAGDLTYCPKTFADGRFQLADSSTPILRIPTRPKTLVCGQARSAPTRPRRFGGLQRHAEPRRPYSSKFRRRRRDWKRGSVRRSLLFLGYGLLQQLNYFSVAFFLGTPQGCVAFLVFHL